MLTQHRLVTLVGVGGIGKTRLALRLATGVVDAHADGVWFVDLAPVSDPRLVANVVASTLGVKEEAGRPLVEALQRFVEDRTLLLVLDNCEHLLWPARNWRRDLLQGGRKLDLVATSREPLHVAGEAAFPLAPLPAPDLGAILARRAARDCFGAAVSRPRDRRPTGLRIDAGERCRGCAHLPRSRRHPAGDRAGGGASPVDVGRHHRRPPDRPVRPAQRPRPDGAAAPADAACRDRLELRPVGAARAYVAAAAVGVRRRVRVRRGRGGRRGR
ncbi:MAG: AAA family ATPase [Betaproteobacteria bacterium]|nr:AAA family ATPase [Betaproteobacteria bacterium]